MAFRAHGSHTSGAHGKKFLMRAKRFTHLFSEIGTVQTNVMNSMPIPSSIWIMDVDGSMAFATTGTDSTAVKFHSGLTGLLWMLNVVVTPNASVVPAQTLPSSYSQNLLPIHHSSTCVHPV